MSNLKISFLLIAFYILLVNIGTVISSMLDIPLIGQIALLLAFSVGLLFYVRKRKLATDIGLTGLKKTMLKLAYTIYR